MTVQLTRLAYASSKGALLTMTKTMTRALVSDHIRVNWVAVGWVATPGEIAQRDNVHGDGRPFLQERSARSPLGRLETVEEIAAGGVAYLASHEASHITGCELSTCSETTLYFRDRFSPELVSKHDVIDEQVHSLVLE